MRKFWMEKRDDIVAWCMIINTIIAGFSVSLQAFKPSLEPELKSPVPTNKQLIK